MTTNVLDQLVPMTVRIECDGGRSTGTGFIFRLCERGTGCVPAIVTNKHVIANSQIGVFHLTVNDGGVPRYGEHVQMEFDYFEPRWVKHPNPDVDLAVFPLAPVFARAKAEGMELFYTDVGKEFIADTGFLAQLTAVEEIIMIGYPNGLWDTTNNIPIVRRGITATPPYIDFEGRPDFLIDCACFPGSSGSPVMLFNAGPYVNKDGTTGLQQGGRVKLLGILWGGPQHLAPGEIRVVPIPAANQPIAISRIPNNLGYCVKAEQLLAFEEPFKKLLAAQEKSAGDGRVEPAAEPLTAGADEKTWASGARRPRPLWT